MDKMEVTTRAINFTPASLLTEFVGTDYSTTGVAKSSLLSLSTIYPSPSILKLANLQRHTTERAVRGRDKAAVPNDETPVLSVVMFKKITNASLPSGLTRATFLEFFTEQFTFETNHLREQFQKSVGHQLENPLYQILAITAPLYKPNEDDPYHHIIAATLYMFDNKVGSYISLIGVSDKGYPDWCTLTEDYFFDPSQSDLLSPTATFRGHGLAVFLLSTLQVLGILGYKAPRFESTAVTYDILCDDAKITHHL